MCTNFSGTGMFFRLRWLDNLTLLIIMVVISDAPIEIIFVWTCFFAFRLYILVKVTSATTYKL